MLAVPPVFSGNINAVDLEGDFYLDILLEMLDGRGYRGRSLG